jgi:hypothetical protein
MRTNHFHPSTSITIGGQMKSTRGLTSLFLAVLLGLISFVSLPLEHVIAQESNTAMQRGYRTGYSDGYMAGYRDILDSKTHDLTRHPDYGTADRAFSKDYGDIEDYRDGYKQGFETGYNAGFDKVTFDSEVPTALARRDAQQAPTDPVATPIETPVNAIPQVTDAVSQPPANVETTAITTQAVQTTEGSIIIPKDTELILELQNPLSTDKNRVGDKFTAKVVSPIELGGAMIEGRINKITKPGRIKRRSEISMTFDRIIVGENRWGNFAATLTEVLPVKGDNVRRVDDEGAAVGKSTLKPDAVTVGAATGTGAAIGGIAAGPVGLAVGAGVGAAFGVGAVVIDRGKDIKLNVNQQLRVKSAYDTTIR